MDKIIIIGCGGHAKSIVDIIEREGKYEIAGFVDKYADKDYTYKGYNILGTDDELEIIYTKGVINAAVGIGYLGKGDIRKNIYHKLKSIGYSLPTVIDPSAVLASNVELNEGVVVGKCVIINADAKIGTLAIINSGAIIEHECIVEEYSHIAVGAVLCGNVKIGESTFVGAAATVIQGVEIGKKCIIGANSIVLSNVDNESKVYGIVK